MTYKEYEDYYKQLLEQEQEDYAVTNKKYEQKIQLLDNNRQQIVQEAEQQSRARYVEAMITGKGLPQEMAGAGITGGALIKAKDNLRLAYENNLEKIYDSKQVALRGLDSSLETTMDSWSIALDKDRSSFQKNTDALNKQAVSNGHPVLNPDGSKPISMADSGEVNEQFNREVLIVSGGNVSKKDIYKRKNELLSSFGAEGYLTLFNLASGSYFDPYQ